MKTHKGSQSKAPLVKGGKRVDSASRLPQWAILAGFHSYTMFSNDVLEAMYAKGQPTRQRIFCWIVRHSSGNQSEYAVLLTAGLQRQVAWRVDIARELNIVESAVTEWTQDLEEEGWIRTDGKRIFLIARPVITPRSVAVTPAIDLPVPKYDDWRRTERKEHFTRWEAARREWNEARQEERNDRKDYEELVESLSAGEATAEGVPKNFVDQTEQGSGPRRKTSRSTEPIITGVRTNKGSPVSECISVTVQETEQVRSALTHRFGFALPDTDPIPAQFASLARDHNLSIYHLAWWMDDKKKAKAKKRYPIESAGALLEWARSELAAWIEQNRGVIEQNPAPRAEGAAS